jgi:AmmeMemoRadiSam system protein A
MILTEDDKTLLLSVARRAIENHLIGAEGPPLPDFPGNLKVKCGAFVSLYCKGRLRGCIGTFAEDEELHRVINRMALAAAFSDTRFSPVGENELGDLKIEISVLSPRKPVSGPDEIVIGKHGIYMKSGHRRGTLLPQVAIKEGWNSVEFLENCARYKAGIGRYGWKEAELYTFEAIIFETADEPPNVKNL